MIPGRALLRSPATATFLKLRSNYETEFFKPLLMLSKNRQHQIAGCKLNHTGYFLPASFGSGSPVAWQAPLLIRSLLILPEFYIRLWEV